MKAQLFDCQPRLTHADRKRLSPHLTGWNRLCALLAGELVSDSDIKLLILIEFEGAKREEIVQKLLGKLASNQRKRVLAALKKHA